MAEFSLTQENPILPASWVSENVETPLTEQYFSNIVNLRRLLTARKINANVNPDDINDFAAPDGIFKRIMDGCDPMRDLYKMKFPTLIDRSWVVSWELYNHFLTRNLQEKILARHLAAPTATELEKIVSAFVKPVLAPRVSIILRSVHVGEHDSNMGALSFLIKKIENNTNTRIVWDTLVLNQPLTPDTFGEWQSKVKNTIKTTNLVIFNLLEFMYTAIAFTLINMSLGGSAIIRIANLKSAADVAMVCIFANCFAYTSIYHTSAADRIYLIGENFARVLSPSVIRKLQNFASKHEVPCPISRISFSQYDTIVAKILDAMGSIYDWRYGQLKKVCDLYEYLDSSASARDFDDYVEAAINETFPSRANQWLKATDISYMLAKPEGAAMPRDIFKKQSSDANAKKLGKTSMQKEKISINN